jgi:hypothetical protein
MATPIPLNFRAAPLPPNFKGTPEQLKEAIVSRLSAESSIEVQFFTSGSIVPTSDYGPFLKDGTTWYVWDTTTAAYIPQKMEYESLKYIPSNIAPSQAKYTVWIELDGTGKAIDAKYYSGGAWKSIFEDKFAQYTTTTGMNAAISDAITANNANYYTKAETDTEISDAIAATASSAGYGAFYTAQVGNKIITNAVDTTIDNFSSTAYNYNSSWNTSNSRFTAGKAGIWQFNWYAQFDGGTIATPSVEIYLYIKNPGGGIRTGGNTSSNDPEGFRWYISGSDSIQLAAGEQLEIVVLFVTPAGTIIMGNSRFSGYLVREL